MHCTLNFKFSISTLVSSSNSCAHCSGPTTYDGTARLPKEYRDALGRTTSTATTATTATTTTTEDTESVVTTEDQSTSAKDTDDGSSCHDANEDPVVPALRAEEMPEREDGEGQTHSEEEEDEDDEVFITPRGDKEEEEDKSKSRLSPAVAHSHDASNCSDDGGSGITEGPEEGFDEDQSNLKVNFIFVTLRND